MKFTANLIDTHVHVYPQFDINTFLDAAYHNFQKEVRRSILPDNSRYYLCLTEKTEPGCFDSLSTEKWTAHPTGQKHTKVLKSGKKSIYLVAGSQIVTKENIEVLAIGTCTSFKKGLTVQDTLLAVERAKACAIIPWGFGKWWGRRGKIIKKLILSKKAYNFFLGDNGGRPRLSCTPKLFKLAMQNHIPILPGSDPLNLSSQQVSAGKCGVILEGEKNLIDLLKEIKTQPKTFGEGEYFFRFLMNQTRILQRKYLR